MSESQRALETLLSNLPGMAYRCLNDPDWTMEFVSDWCLPLTGYRPEDLIGNRHISYGQLVHPDDRDTIWAEVQEALAEDRPFQMVYRLITASGDQKWVWEQGRGVRSAVGDLLALEGLVLDITRLRRLEEQTASSERKFRALYEHANDAIFLMRGDTFIDCNPKTEAIFGCSREQMLQRRPYEFSPPHQSDGRDSKSRALEKIDAARAGTPQVFEWKHTKLDGTPFDAEVSLSRVDIEGAPAVLAIVRDVTERVQAYQLLEQRVAERTAELQTSEARYRDLFERSRDAIFIGVEGRYVSTNQAGVELVGATLEEVAGAAIEEYLADPADRVRLWNAVAAGGGSVKDFEIRLRRKDGTLLDCLLTAHTYPDREAGQVGLEGIVRDITEWKRTEEDLFQQTRESAVLDERNRMAREIHDTLAQGLTGIVLQLEAAQQARESGLEAMESHIQRAKGLARESLQEARRSVWNLVPQPLEGRDLTAALDEEVRRFSARGRERAQLTVTGVPRPLPSSMEAALLRICQEALMNVRKYAQAGRVQVTLEYADDAVRLTVVDDGKGFAPESQVVGGDGGGFGLTSMQERARMHGGTFRIDAAPGHGARIEVTLPTNADGRSLQRPPGSS